MPLHVVLFQPEIPPNTGNVIRLCANTGARLHLVKPLGFRLDARSVRRSGLDYHDLAEVQVHANLEACLASLGSPPRWFAFTTRGVQSHDAVAYAPDDVLVFGPETRGLPDDVLAACPAGRRLRIPMLPEARSLNLSNAVAVAVYEAWRQLGWSRGGGQTPAGPRAQ
jgi:tRNA (cytidine/uridine-2'-O-)-methyltransferase